MNYHELIDNRRDEIVAFLRDIILIPSVRGEPLAGMPFGAGVARSYDFMCERALADGFEVFDADGFGGHVEWAGAQTDECGDVTGAAEKTLGIPVHLDVVPAGVDWAHEPFGAEIVDADGEERMYGRGTTDNKNAVVAVYEAMKALRDSGFVPAKNIRLILGLDEETGWSGMEKYLASTDAPDFGFTPDADFPAINGEMGIIDFELAKKLSRGGDAGIVLRSIEGGNAPNMVPDRARAIILDDTNKSFSHVKAKLSDFREATGYHISGKGVGKAFEIVATGASAHGSRPQDGLNAVSVLLKFLGELEISNESIREFIDFYNRHIGFEFHGEGLGVGLSDGPSGKLILNVGKIGMDSEAVLVTINVRYPVTLTDDSVYDAMLPLIHEHDLGIVKLDHKPPIYFPEDEAFIETLMSVYREQTGDTESRPFVTGGGTYARAIPNAVAFGPKFPGDPDVMHRPDEYTGLSELMKITHIYAETIKRLTDTA